jgi:WXXGXW repeat (2 copies)
MKNKSIKIVVAFIVSLTIAQYNYAQFVIRVRPVAPRVVRVVAPSPRHVWVEEDWRWQNNNYISSGGYWSAPPRGRAVWVKGHWKQSRRGWVWKPGHWR